MNERQPGGEVKIIRVAPEVSDYLRLREQAGMSPRSAEGAATGLANSLFAISLHDVSGLAGMGRVVGDGGCFMQVVDIIVRPDLQGRGLGKMIMKEIMRYLEGHAAPLTYVSLIADVPADALYRPFGFEYTSPGGLGMYWRKH
ncbi:GNAT family N-acetyltransferase [Paenibacillus sp. MBLB2552]|uniref:GNAT family N-acetyltransferase n=1 Tax=Paenibacillus mellifer TaxID=2937794 RepID=A0A9X1Y3C4_9BACL|nr:GNAT family N-acetyltransferase [Paenibacillus mellifer]MCK8490182.1 GNAT family N-acetyltransferase [Paenibacillus mellifer]